MTRAYKSAKLISGSEVELPDVPSDVTKQQIVVSEAGTDKTTWLDSDQIVGQPGADFDGRYITDDFRTGTAETLTMYNLGGIVSMDNAAANTLTIPPNSTVPFPVRTRIDVHQEGAGLTTIVAGAGVTLVSYQDGLKSYGRYSGISLWKISTNKWGVYGATV